MRRHSGIVRWGLLLSAVMLGLAGCSATHNSAVRSSAKTTTSTAPSTSTPVQPSTTAVSVKAASVRCQSSQLTLAIGASVSEPTEQQSLLLTLTNEGQAPCYLFGYPGVTLYDSQGRVLPLAYKRGGDQVVTSSPPQRVDLAPGATGFVMINKNHCVNDGAVATTLRLIPPDDTVSITLDVAGLRDLPAGARDFAYCGPGDPGSTVAISPVAPTGSATEAH